MPSLASLSRLVDGRARCELGFTAPFALLAGGLYGFQLGGGPAVMAGSAVALLLFVALQVSLEPTVVSVLGGSRGQWGPAVAFGWDVLTGAVIGFPVFWLLDLPAGPAVGAAASLGAFYGWTMGYVVCGEAPEAVVKLVLHGGGAPRASEHSYAQSLEARGDLEAAADLYRRAVVDTPTDPGPYMSLARLQRGPLDQPSAAVKTLRAALRDARLEERGEMMVLRRIIDVYQGMGRPFGAAPDLARYVETHAHGDATGWAAKTLADMKQRMEDERAGPDGAEGSVASASAAEGANDTGRGDSHPDGGALDEDEPEPPYEHDSVDLDF